jgi:hypothetical protein
MSDRDREEILALMREETAAYFRQDFTAMRACWVDSPSSRFMRSYSGLGVKTGTRSQGALIRALLSLWVPTKE